MDTQHKKESKGALIGSVIIVLVLLIGGGFLIKATKLNYEQAQKNAELQNQIDNPIDGATELLKSQSDSDEIDSIEKDLNDTQLDAISQ